MGAVYRKAIKWRDSITLSEETGNNVEKITILLLM